MRIQLISIIMRIIEIIVVFLSLFVILGGLSIPLWWGYAQPHIFRLPEYIDDIGRNINELIDLLLQVYRNVRDQL